MALGNLSASSAAPGKRGPDCSVCSALSDLEPDKAALIEGALRNPRWRYTEIAAEVASDESLPEWIRNIHHSTYARHAKGGCAARTKLR